MTDADARLNAAFTAAQYRAAEMPDSDYYRERATAAGGPVLELGCGSGRIYLALVRAGVDADGIDLSTASLSVLRENAAEEGLEPTVWQGDMTQFTLDAEKSGMNYPWIGGPTGRGQRDPAIVRQSVLSCVPSSRPGRSRRAPH